MKTFAVFAVCLTILVVSGSEAAKVPPKPEAPEASKPQTKPTTPRPIQHHSTTPQPSSNEDDSSSSEEHSRLHRLLTVVPHAIGNVVGGQLDFVADTVDKAVDITQDVIKHGTDFISDKAGRLRSHGHNHKN